jgi:hypothetical protein
LYIRVRQPVSPDGMVVRPSCEPEAQVCPPSKERSSQVVSPAAPPEMLLQAMSSGSST